MVHDLVWLNGLVRLSEQQEQVERDRLAQCAAKNRPILERALKKTLTYRRDLLARIEAIEAEATTDGVSWL